MAVSLKTKKDKTSRFVLPKYDKSSFEYDNISYYTIYHTYLVTTRKILLLLTVSYSIIFYMHII